ncbi:hypothetical protein ACF0H5_022629 [Mactra antiquata]
MLARSYVWWPDEFRIDYDQIDSNKFSALPTTDQSVLARESDTPSVVNSQTPVRRYPFRDRHPPQRLEYQ